MFFWGYLRKLGILGSRWVLSDVYVVFFGYMVFLVFWVI